MDVEEFKIKIYPFKDKLYRFAKRFLVNREEAEDTVQDVFMKLWQKRYEINKNGSAEGLAMTMTKNLCIDKIRAAKYIKFEGIYPDLSVDNLTPLKKMELNDSINKLEKILSQLPQNQSLILHLRDIEGYPFDEIAEIMNMTKENIKVNLSRARKKVREILLKKYQYENDGY